MSVQPNSFEETYVLRDRFRFPFGLFAGALMLSFTLLMGCGGGGSASDVPAPINASPRQLLKVKNGTQMISPVSNKEIVKSKDTPSLYWDGKLYMFCCDNDRKKFQDNPTLYADSVLPPNAVVLDDSK